MQDVELRLVANNSQAVRAVKELATESNKLYANNEKQQKRQVGLITDVENALKELQDAQKNAMTIEHIKKYNQKIAEAKQTLKEYETAGVKANEEITKSGNSMVQSLKNWILGFASVAAGLALVSKALGVLKDAFKETTFGMNTFNLAAAGMKQILNDIVTLNAWKKGWWKSWDAWKESIIGVKDNLQNALNVQIEFNKLRAEERQLNLDAKDAEIEYRQLLIEANDHRKTATERIKAYDEAIKAHNKNIDIQKGIIQHQLDLTNQLWEKNKTNETLLDKRNQLELQLKDIEAGRSARLKEITSMKTGLMESELDSAKKTSDQLYLYYRDQFFQYLDDIEKANRETAKQMAKDLEDEWNFNMEIGKWRYDTDRSNAKDAWDQIIKDDKEKIKLDEELRIKRVDAIKQGLDELFNYTQKITDRNAEDARRNREILDERVSQLQQELNTEVELYKAGYASNVAAKQKELDNLKKQRDKALKDEEAAIQKQRTMESIAQGVNIFTSTTQILKSFTKLGPLGLALAAGAIATMFTLIASVKKKTSDVTKLTRGGHGEVSGRLHSEGGERFLDHVEIEQGERWGVLSRSASRKYGSSFNKIVDSFNRDALNVHKESGVVNNVLLDTSMTNGRLDQVISEQKKMNAKEEILIMGNLTIIKKGNSVRTIKR